MLRRVSVLVFFFFVLFITASGAVAAPSEVVPDICDYFPEKPSMIPVDLMDKFALEYEGQDYTMRQAIGMCNDKRRVVRENTLKNEQACKIQNCHFSTQDHVDVIDPHLKSGFGKAVDPRLKSGFGKAVEDMENEKPLV